MKFFFLLVVFLLTSNSAYSTIDVMVKTPDCVVFASDSRISGSNIIASDTYEKIVPVCATVMTQMQGQASIRGLTFKAFINKFKFKYKIEDVDTVFIEEFNILFSEYCDEYRNKNIGFGDLLISIAGIDSSGEIKLYGIRPNKDTIPTERFPGYYSFAMFGNDRILSYIVNGYSVKEISKNKVIDLLHEKFMIYDSTLYKDVLDSIKEKIDPEFQDLFTKLGPEIDPSRFSILDAIEFAYYTVRMTTLIDRLSFGRYKNLHDTENIIPTTGGRILVGALTHNGFKWVKEPDLEIK